MVKGFHYPKRQLLIRRQPLLALQKYLADKNYIKNNYIN
tara:strand:+ start:2454 stop:2570 length:117 start_codon:yes stop_codon:yes gene_type:complete